MRLPLALALLFVSTVAARGGGGPTVVLPAVDEPPVMLLGPEFPIEVNVSRPAALLHWLDSLAALHGPDVTGGKTVDVHRDEFRRIHGRPSSTDVAQLGHYVALRRSLANDGDGRRSLRFMECFVSSRSVEQAVSHCSKMLSLEQRADLAASVGHFDERYEPVWREGLVVREFLARVLASPRRAALTSFLVDLAGFFGVSPIADPPPRVLLAPVPFGSGTHAQTLGRYLLIEVRPGEGLFHEIPPIVHEIAHFLEQRLPDSRRRALRRAAAAHGMAGIDTWRRLHEALPTALAQGAAGERFQGRFWSTERSWYHLDAIDRYAKRIFPIVRGALDRGRTLDPELVDALVRAHPAVGSAARRDATATPRSP